MKQAPRLARWLLRRLLPPDNRNDIIGDLDEEYTRHIAGERGRFRARAWYWRQALGTLPRLVGRDLSRDLRFAGRALRRQPGFTAAAVATLALGIGANTAIFSIVNAVLLRPLPYAEPGRLVHVFEFDPTDSSRRSASWPEYVDWRRMNRTFAEIAGHDGSSRTLTGIDGADRVSAAQVTDNFFRTLGVTPHLGRTFEAGEAGRDAARVVVLTHESWQRRFGADPAALGQVLTLSEIPHTVIGVLPADFEFSLRGAAELYLPLDLTEAEETQRYRHWMDLIGRLDGGVTIDQAQADLTTLARAAAPDVGEWHAGVSELVVPLHEVMVGRIRPALLVLLAAVGVVLLATCANVAGLMLARSASRARERSTRAAPGAGRRRLLQQLHTESLLLAFLGGAAGLLVGAWGLSALVAAIPQQQRLNLPQLRELSLDPAMIGAAVALTLVTGVLVGWVPAWRGADRRIHRALQWGGRAGAAHRRRPFIGGLPGARATLVGAEVVMAVVLVAGAGVLGKSVVRLLQVTPGFDPDGVLTMAINVPADRYETREAVLSFHRDALARLAALPGVAGVATINQLPFAGPGNSGTFTVEGEPLATGETDPEVGIRTVSADYFDVLGVPLLAGRGFAPADDATAPPVVLVNQALAERYFPERGPLGRRIAFAFFRNAQPLEIVGIVGDERFAGPDQPVAPVLYFCYAQSPDREFRLVARTAPPPLSLAGPMRAEIAAMDRSLPVYEVETMNGITARHGAVFLRRYVLRLVGAFAALSLLLAAVGLYGVMAQSVVERTREIGVRLALGADRRDVVRMVVREGMAPALAGLIAGTAAALAALRLLGSLLYEVSPYDPAGLAGVAALLGVVAVLSCWVPARRAARVDPVVCLRAE